MSKYYDLDGDSVTKKNKECPKCGTGYFMAEHKDRYHCGKCSFSKKK